MYNGFMLQLDDRKLFEMISKAKYQVLLSLPSIHDNFITFFSNLKSKNINFTIIINASEDNIRHGFGTLAAIKRAKEHGLNILNFSDNHVSFIISDDIGYFIFPKSRMFSEFNDGINAVQMDSLMIHQLLAYYLPKYNLTNINNQKIQDDTNRLLVKLIKSDEKANLHEIKDVQLRELDNKLKENPPLNPDFHRIVTIYSTKIQFVELNFQGANIHIKKVDIPRHALPIKDEVLRNYLESKLRIFTNLPENEDFNKFFEFKLKIDAIRDKYLIYLPSHKKRIIKKKDKQDFLKELNNQIELIEELKKQLRNIIQKEIIKSKKMIKQELLAFFEANPPENYPHYEDTTLFEDWNNDNVSQIIAKIRYPKPDELLDSLSITCHFYDITYEDLKDSSFLEKLKESEIITQKEREELVEFSKGYKVKE